MCGRYNFSQELPELQGILSEIQKNGEAVKTGEIFPTNNAPILLWEDGTMRPRALKWGFPRWQGSGVIINARSETAMDKRMFRPSLLARRCIIPASGFYEWGQPEGKKKEKYYLQMPDARALYMAGFYQTFQGEKPYTGFVILTTGASESVSRLHHRMPVVLEREDLQPWLHDSATILPFLDRSGPELLVNPA